MYKIDIYINQEPTNEPVISINVMNKKYSLPKLYMPKKNGKLTVEKGKRWYVYFYYRNPETQKLDKFKYSHNINRFKTVAERKAIGKALVSAYTEMLSRGFDPFKKINDIQPKKTKLKLAEALKMAFSLKRNEWSDSTITGNEFWLNNFVKWLEKNNLHLLDLDMLSKEIVIDYLNELTIQGKGNTTINNARSSISSIFGKLLKDGKIQFNPAQGVEKRKSSPQKNKPFTPDQISDIKKYLLKNDKYLYYYIKFVMYAFLRNREIVRLKVGDIDLKNNLLYVKTKTESRASVRIIEPLFNTIKELEISSVSPSYFVFSKTQKPDFWEASEKTKVDWFGIRFRSVKNHFQLGDEYGIYSFRHSAAKDVFLSFIREGKTQKEAMYKMMEITRHKSESGLKNYLRDIGAFVPKDYAFRYSLDF